MAEPTDEQLYAYSRELPQVYQTLLYGFIPERGSRRAGTAMTFETLDEILKERYMFYREQDTSDALAQLVIRGFMIERQEPVLHYTPTPLGERLIAASTGKEPDPEKVPALPELTWA